MSAVSLCSACGASMEWVRTATGKRMPLDPEPHAEGNVVIVDGTARVYRNGTEAAEAVPGVARFRSHFVTCPKAGEFRR